MSYCGECYYQGKKLKPCSTCYCGSEAKTELTNADRIRSMSDEELAEFIDKVSRTCLVDALGGKSECNTECKICKIKFGSILNWLQSEAE